MLLDPLLVSPPPPAGPLYNMAASVTLEPLVPGVFSSQHFSLTGVLFSLSPW